MSAPSPAQVAAEHQWARRGPEADDAASTPSPVCVLMAGPPMAGKTTLARALVDALEPAVHVENDALRRAIVDAMDRKTPRFDAEETQATYEAARRMVERALEADRHAVHDATNLDRAHRELVLEAARAHGVDPLVVLVQAPEPVRRSRAREAGPAALRAHEALGQARPDADAFEDPVLAVDGTQPPSAHLDAILDRLEAPVRRSSTPRESP